MAYDEVARLWDTASGKELAVLRQEMGVRHAVVSPDGSRVLTLSAGDEPARLWEATSGRQLGVLHRDRIAQIAFAPNASRVMILSEDGTVHLFPVFGNTRALVAHALKVVPRRLSTADRQRYFLTTD